MEEIFGKHFSITEPKNINTVIYKVNKTEKEFLKDNPKFTIERLDYTKELVGNNVKKTFFIYDPHEDGNQLVIFSFGKEKVVLNVGYLETNTNMVKISNKPIPMNCKTIYNEEETEFREFAYTPNLKRPMTIIDPETTEEMKPTLYLDKETNEIKGKCKLKAGKSYVVFEIKENNYD